MPQAAKANSSRRWRPTLVLLLSHEVLLKVLQGWGLGDDKRQEIPQVGSGQPLDAGRP
ncbi:MAG: hypothetical protein ACJA2W_001838 [Planctomycetota bacterium]|jgi:hypothetical protein